MLDQYCFEVLMKKHPRETFLYGITGFKGSGKDTFASYVLKENPGFVRVAFADTLKDLVSKVFSLDRNLLDDPQGKDTLFETPITIDAHLTMLIAATGLNLQPKGLLAHSAREVLQFVATDYIREVSPDYWLVKGMDKVRELRGRGCHILITDVRFENEAQLLRDQGGKIISIRRLARKMTVDAHVSEQGLSEASIDLELGVLEGGVSLYERLAILLGKGKFKLALAYDYRRASQALQHYQGGGSLPECVALLGIPPVKECISFRWLRAYYGVPSRVLGILKNNHTVQAEVEGKVCQKCRGWKPLTSYHKSGRTSDGLHSVCRDCASSWHKANYQQYGKLDTLERTFDRYQKSSKRRGLEFLITREDFFSLWEKQKGVCAYSGVVMTTDLNCPKKVTIDRVDSSLGYLHDNIVLCARVPNMMKNSLSLQDFREWVKALATHLEVS